MVNDECTMGSTRVSHPGGNCRRQAIWSVNKGAKVRSVGIVTLLSVAASTAAPSPPAKPPAPLVTAKSTAVFADCFARHEDRRGAPWWFMPNESGGTLSNIGRPSVQPAYFISITDLGARRQILIQGAAPDGPETKAVNQCI